jgi:hypothetical protein
MLALVRFRVSKVVGTMGHIEVATKTGTRHS